MACGLGWAGVLGFALGSGMGGFCGWTDGLAGSFGVAGFGGSGGFSESTGEPVNALGITYTSSSVSQGRGGIAGGSGFVGSDFGGKFEFSDPDRDGGFDLGGGGGGVSGKTNLSNIGLPLSVKLSGLAPFGISL